MLFNRIIMKLNIKSTPIKIIFAAVILLLPVVVRDPYILRILIMVGIYIILVSSLNIVNGFTGLYCIGFAGFYGIGAYTSAILSIRLGVPFWIALPIAGIFAGFLGSMLGLITTRLGKIFLAVATIGFGEIVRILILNWSFLTRGPLGIPNIPLPEIFGIAFTNYIYFYYLILIIASLVVFIIRRIYISKIGRAFVAIREDEVAAAAMGMNVYGYKILSFTIACFFAGIAGSIYAHFSRYISADQFAIAESFNIMTMLVVGGQGSIIGPIAGSFLLVLVPELFRFLEQFRMLLYGIILILVVILKPEGIAGDKGLFVRQNKIIRQKKRSREYAT